MGLEEFNGIFFYCLRFWEALTVVEVDEVGRSVILTSLSAFGTISGEVSYFSALETGIRGISCSGRIALEVVLWAVPLVSVRILPSAEVVSSIVSPVVSSGWCPVPVYVHWNRGVVHPTGGVRRIVLRCALSLRAWVIPLGARLLRGKSSEVSVPSEYVSEQHL